jgi:hypothetical protein
MPTIRQPILSVAPHDDLTRATVRVRCNVAFTDFEVNAMNRLGLRYTLRCRVLNHDLWYETTSLVLDDVELPRVTGAATGAEEVVFEKIESMGSLREHVFTRDQLLAELTLVNQETGEEQVVRGETLTVDLAA